MNIPASMMAVQLHGYGGVEMLRYEEVPCPKVDEGQALIRVHAAAINPLDWKIRAGHIRFPINPRVREGHPPLRVVDGLPQILGVDVAGVVVALGAGVDGFTIGDAVYASPIFGGHAEYVTVSASDVAHMPRTLNFVQAAAVPIAATTAWQGLIEVMQLRAGQRLLIHGAAGGIGTYAVQVAKWRGAYVVGTASTRNLPYLLELGADEAIDYISTRFEREVEPVDVILDLIGGETQARSWAVLKPDGVMVTIYSPLTRESAPADPPRLRLYGTARPLATNLMEIARLVDEGHVRPVVSTVLPLHEARRAHQLIESGHTRGKIVLAVDAL